MQTLYAVGLAAAALPQALSDQLSAVSFWIGVVSVLDATIKWNLLAVVPKSELGSLGQTEARRF
jgi:hypothetical protein